jgi:hypothetical protein
MRAPHLVVTVLLAALLSACGGGEDDSRSDDDDATPRPLPRGNGYRTLPPADQAPDTDREPAGEVLRKWGVRFGLTGTGRWTMAFDLEGVGSHQQSGSYAVRPARFEAESTIEMPDAGLALELTARTNRRGSWMQFSAGDVDLGRCWVPLDSPALVEALGGSAPSAGLPPPVAVLATATRPRWDEVGGTMTARTDLFTTLSVLGSRVTTALGVPVDDRHRTSVTLRLSDGQIAGWQVDAGQLLRDAAAAGFSTPEIDPDTLAEQTISSSIVLEELPVPVPDPPARLERPLGDDEAAFEESLAGCGGSSGAPGTPA